MSTTISRTHYDTLIDDDGSGLTGSVWDKADVDALLDAIDAMIANGIVFGGSITERGRSAPMGEWISVPFSAGNFVATGGLTWSPVSGEIQNNQYMLIGKTLYWKFNLANVTTGGTTGGFNFTLPGGLAAAVGGNLAFMSGHCPGIGWGNIWNPSTSASSSIISMTNTSFSVAAGTPNYLTFDLILRVQ